MNLEGFVCEVCGAQHAPSTEVIICEMLYVIVGAQYRYHRTSYIALVHSCVPVLNVPGTTYYVLRPYYLYLGSTTLTRALVSIQVRYPGTVVLSIFWIFFDL